jgi:hypothetical protein
VQTKAVLHSAEPTGGGAGISALWDSGTTQKRRGSKSESHTVSAISALWVERNDRKQSECEIGASCAGDGRACFEPGYGFGSASEQMPVRTRPTEVRSICPHGVVRLAVWSDDRDRRWWVVPVPCNDRLSYPFDLTLRQTGGVERRHVNNDR